MEKQNIVKEYTNGELTILWEPAKCIHAGECVKALPQVYKPKEKPWIKIDQASTQSLKDQIALCPSGALSYLMNGEGTAIDMSELETKVEVMPNGPLLVYGSLKVIDQAGHTSTKSKTTAFCRCGASNNKPYCDGSHLKAGFKD